MNALSISTPRAFPVEAEVPLVWQPGDLILDTYEVNQVFTTGGLAYVYGVYHREWQIDLAVKSPKILDERPLTGSVDYYVREAETWVRLGLHPHIVSCYFIRVLNGLPRVFMEFVDGPSLLEALETGSLYAGPAQAVLPRLLDIAIQFAWGLHYAHGAGLVHQDVKPANLLLATDGTAKVTDFGMAQASSALQPGSRRAAVDFSAQVGDTLLVDATGFTPAYCSPEQAAGSPLTRRTDVWSWAVSVLEMFTGGKTWKNGLQAPEALQTYLQTGPRRPGIPAMPAGLANLLGECLANDPPARPHDMGMLATALKGFFTQAAGHPYPRLEPRLETILADTINNRAVSLIDLGKMDDALDLLDQALKTETTHPAALYNRNLLLWRNARLTDEAALARLEENEEILAGRSEPAYTLGLLHLERGDTAGALEAAQKIRTAEAPTNTDPPAARRLRQAAGRLGRYAGRCLQVFPAGEGSVSSAAVSADGSRVLAGSSDARLRIWTSGAATCQRILEGHASRIQAVTVRPDGRVGLSGDWDGEIRLWDLESGPCLQVLSGHSGFITALAFLPGNRTALSASGDGTLRVWDLITGDCREVIEGHLDAVSAAAVFPNGRFAISASYDNSLRIWDLANHNCLATYPWTRGCTSNLSLAPDGRRALLAGGDHQLWLIDLANGQPLRAFTGHRSSIKAVHLAADHGRALSASLDGTLRLWDLETGRCLRTFFGHTAAVNALAVPPGAALALTGSSDGTLRLWLLGRSEHADYLTVLPRSSQELLELSRQVEAQVEAAGRRYAEGDYPGALGQIKGVRMLPGQAQDPRLMEIWDRIGSKGARCGLRSSWVTQRFRPHPGRANTLAFTASAGRVLTGGDDGLLRLWDLKTLQRLREFAGHQDRVRSIALANGRRLALSGSNDAMLRVWDLEAGACTQVLAGHANAVNAVAISPDGRWGLSGSSDNTVRLWDLEGGRSLQVFTGHTHAVHAVALTPDGRLGLSAGWDKTLQVWDLNSGERLHRLEGHSGVIDALALAPDGRLAVTGGLDGALRIWDVLPGRMLGVIDARPAYFRALAISTEGRFLFSGDQYGALQVWELPGGRRMHTLESHAGSTAALAVSLDNRWLAALGGDSFLTVWRLDWDYEFPLQIG